MKVGRGPAQTTIGVDHITGKSRAPGRDQTTTEKLHIGCPIGKSGLGASPRPAIIIQLILFVNRQNKQKNKMHICASCIVCFVVGIIPHVFSLRTLVHIYIPHTYTPCGRCLCRVTSYCDNLCLGVFPRVPHLYGLIISGGVEFVNPFFKFLT